jgi:hypothetical protein
LETRRIPFAPQHYDARADTDTGVEVYDVPIGQPYAARGHERADGRWLIGAVNAIHGLAEIKCARAERIARTTRHEPGTLAEMVAFARLGSVACQRLVPDVEGIHALALLRLIKPSLTDKEIVAKEKEVKRRRDRLELSRWCRLYASEMEQARILVEVLRRQN